MAYIHIDWLSVPDSLLSPARPWDSETKMLVLTAYMRVFFIITFSNICPWIFMISIISYHLSGKFHKILPFVISIIPVLEKSAVSFPAYECICWCLSCRKKRRWADPSGPAHFSCSVFFTCVPEFIYKFVRGLSCLSRIRFQHVIHMIKSFIHIDLGIYSRCNPSFWQVKHRQGCPFFDSTHGRGIYLTLAKI